MTEPVHGRKPVLALLTGLLWAAVLLLPVFCAQAGVVLTPLYSIAATSRMPPHITAAYLNDIASGSDGGDADDLAIPGYDFVTGLGSPVANNLVPALSLK
jgi:hypothetical protein